MKNHWYMVSSHGAVLFYIAVCPDCTVAGIADAMSLTRRSIWGIIGDLRHAGVIKVRREGRRHHYSVNMDSSFRHPILNGIPLRVVLGEVVARYARKEPQRELKTTSKT